MHPSLMILYLILLWCAVTFVTALIASNRLHEEDDE
jgi:hypothetical protein